MGCEECEKIRLEHPGALCGNCAGIVQTLYAEVKRLDRLILDASTKVCIIDTEILSEAARIRGERG